MPDRPIVTIQILPLAVTLCVALALASTALAQTVPPTADGAPASGGVAVLPFANISGDSADDWIGAGIAETVSADLSRLGMASVLGVAPSDGQGNDALGLADDAQARRVARDLDVPWVIAGGFQRVGGTLRIVARILEVETGDVRRTVTLDGTADDLFMLQDRIVVELSDGFDLSVASGVQRRPVGSGRAPEPEGSPSTAASPPGGRTTALAPAPVGGALGGNAGDPRVVTSVPTPVRPLGGGPAGFLGSGTPSSDVTGAEFGSFAGRPVVRPTRTNTPPDIDGRIDDEVWRTSAAVTRFVQQSPLDGAPASEDTELRVAYDSENIYLAFHVKYADPRIMRANRVDRDQANEDDLVTVYLDPFFDQQRSYVFDVNGYGVQGDGIISQGGGGSGGGRGRRGGGSNNAGIPAPDRSWDALFDSAAQIVANGYTAELAIPFKSLRYPQLDSTTPHRWGLQVVRSIKGKDNEADVWAPISRDVTGFMTQMGVLEGMTGLSTSRNIEILPTFTGINFGSLDAAGGFPEDFSGEGGLDVKYGITSNLTANFTFNPDFSQIESDIPQVDVNQRFPLFFPELRPFFLEGQEIFNFPSPVNWVNTRTIVNPRFGAKLTGKVGDVSLGLLAADDEAPGNLDDTSSPAYGQTAQVFVTRVRYDVYAESYMGALVTDREFVDGYSRAIGTDGQMRIGQTSTFNWMAFQTLNRDQEGVETSGPSWGLFLQRNGRNLRLSSFTGSSHPDARTDVGFLRRVNSQEFYQTAQYRWWPEHWLINWGPRVRYERLYDYDWILEDERIETGLDFTFARSISAGGGVERSLERFGGVDFWKWRYTADVDVATSRFVSVGADFSFGDQVFFSDSPFLGEGVEASLSLLFRPVARLQSQVNVESSRLKDRRAGDVEVFDIKLFRALTTYQFTERLVLRNITEFNTFADTLGVNLLATYRINAGTVFYFGYDDHYRQRDQIEMIGDELLLRKELQRTNRAVFTKLQYLFRL